MWLLNEKKQNKISTASRFLPILVFLLGLIITYTLADSFHKSDKKYRYEGLKALTSDFFKNQNLLFNNSILRLQHFNEFSTLARSQNYIQKKIVEQIVGTTIFQRTSLYRIVNKAEVDGLPSLKLINRFRNKTDTLPVISNEYLQSPLIRQKIAKLLKDSSANTIAINKYDGIYYIVLIMRSNTNSNEFLLFTSSLDQFLKEWPVDENLHGIMKDNDTQFEIMVHYDAEKRNLTFTDDADSINKIRLGDYVFDKNYFVDEDYHVSLEWFYTQRNELSHFVMLIISFGLTISTLASLFLRFILDQNRRIYRLVINRTEQLEQAMKHAQEANQAKTQFLANMSHELRTPLNLILGMNEILQSRTQDSKSIEYLRNMQSAGEHLLNLITDLISMSKDQTSDLLLKSAPFKTLKFFEEIGFIIGPECFKKNIDFKISIAHDMPSSLTGDSVKIRQVILNLLRNSLKYTTKGNIALHVRLMKIVQTNTAHVQIEVVDTGIGIPKNKMNLIFNRFFQVDEAKILAEGGVGLGLSIVKDLVAKMNGNITVKSDEGLGSSFKVDLDLESTDAMPWINHYKLVKHNQNKILLIDGDNPFNLGVAKELLPQNQFVFANCRLADYLAAPQKFAEHDTFIFFNRESALPAQFVLQTLQSKNVIFVTPDLTKSEKISETDASVINDHPLLASQLFKAVGFVTGDEAKTVAQDALNNQLLHMPTTKTTVLIVDDDYGNRELMRAYLTGTNYELYFAENGQEGFEQFCSQRPQIVLADLRMPVMNGFELADAIRKYERENLADLPATPIVLLTADALEETANKVKSYRIDMYLTKPIRRTKLLESLKQLSSQQGPSAV